MGKNKRKKKQKEEDFKKVKLKVGKTLPKGTNETQTSFKSRGIVVPSQDLTKEGQLTNTRKQGLKVRKSVCHIIRGS
jgi:pre-rRNA-processing protein IPI1